ncbi:PACE efflux transporter [Oricola nitratireducens]|uniref:PACE efflux transporter n=1 Tax=Oricola nitratireducens TaxID=2775868 RepID=UPI0018672EC0|nr:PACE efflux transporter [Oricola nitratireducens]
MRSTPDRIRHTISFEILAILMVVLLGNRLFGMPAMNMGAVGIASSVVAMIWNYLYNLGFDHALLRLTESSRKKGFGVRVLHAVLFEFLLTVLLLPVIVIILGVSLREALVIDLSLTVFFLVYTFTFNLVYDRIFPIPE